MLDALLSHKPDLLAGAGASGLFDGDSESLRFLRATATASEMLAASLRPLLTMFIEGVVAGSPDYSLSPRC